MKNEFYTLHEEYREKHYQLPKVFYHNSFYDKNLSNDAKTTYAILHDRLQLSIKNEWVDNQGKIYFIYTVDNLSKIINCGNKKIAKIKQELIKMNLLFQKRQGLNKPNLLYLLKPIFSESNSYIPKNQSEFYFLNEEMRDRYYQLPKVFYHNSFYDKNLSNDAKTAYAILRDRLQLSIKNEWVDDQGKIYFIYTVEDLSKIMNCGNKKIAKIKQELIKMNLLFQKRQGLNKPNLLYLLKPKVTDSDIYKINEAEKDIKPLGDKEVSKGHVQKCQKDTSRSVKRTRQEVSKGHTNDTDSNDTDSNDTDNNLNNLYTNHSNHSSISDSKNNFDKDSHEKDMILNKYPNQIQSILKTLNSKDCKLAIDIILKAKSNIIKEYGKEFYRYGCDFSLEEHDQEIADTVRRVINEVKSKNSTLEKYQAYLMTSIKNYYKDYADYMLQEQIKRDMVNTDVSNLFKM